MKETKSTPTIENEAALAEQPQEANHKELIKSQVLAKIGTPPRWHRIEVSKHHGSKYRVNIWEQPEPDKHIAVTPSLRIRSSYYLTVSDKGEIINSNPPMPKLCSPN
jgi:hypothetical protein